MTALARSSYSETERDEAMLAYYICGSYRKAEQETGIARQTIHGWVQAQPERFEELVKQHKPLIEAQLAERAQRTALKAIEATDQMIAAVTEDDDISAKDAAVLAGAARNFMTTAGIATDKKLTLEGKPTSYVQHLSAEEAIHGIARMAGITLEGTAEDVTESPEVTESLALQGQTRTPNAPEQG